MYAPKYCSKCRRRRSWKPPVVSNSIHAGTGAGHLTMDLKPLGKGLASH
jgi:hypothetical protein